MVGRTKLSSIRDVLLGGPLLLGHMLAAPLLRAGYNRKGATDSEVTRSMPGDELVKDPKLTYTRAVTIEATPAEVWPWLVQMGQGRGGLYSFDTLENLVGCDIHSTNSIQAEHQILEVGDIVRSGVKDSNPCWAVTDIEPEKHLVLIGAGTSAQVEIPATVEVVPAKGYAASTWQWLLVPDEDRTRLIVRQRLTYSPGQTVMWRIVEPINYVMEHEMLRGIKQRAEAGRSSPTYDVADEAVADGEMLKVRSVDGAFRGESAAGGQSMDRSLPIATAAKAQIGGTVPGLAVVAVSAEQALVSEGHGWADLSSGVAMEPATVCNWFSMTKLVTATAAMQLAERGDLDLDAPVDHYYKPFAMTRSQDRGRAVTVRHLLSHSSGLANPIPLRWVHLATESGPDRGEFVRSILQRHRRLRFDAGTSAAYSNLGYLVLGEVMERAAGVSFEAYVKTNVLEPLGMRHTGFTADPARTWATPYQKRRSTQNALMPVLVPRGLIGPNHDGFRSLNHFYLDGAAYGGLVGPASEAGRFLQAHLRDGELDGNRILSPESTKAMRTMIAHDGTLEVGLGWYQRGKNPTDEFVEHLGGGAGFWNCMRLYHRRNLGVVVMGNATSYDHDSIATAAARTTF